MGKTIRKPPGAGCGCPDEILARRVFCRWWAGGACSGMVAWSRNDAESRLVNRRWRDQMRSRTPPCSERAAVFCFFFVARGCCVCAARPLLFPALSRHHRTSSLF